MASAANRLAPITRAFLASADDVARLTAPASSDHKTPRQTLYFPIPDDAHAAADDDNGDGDDYAGDEEEDEDLGKLLELFPREQLISFLLSAATRDPRTLHRTPLSASAKLRHFSTASLPNSTELC
uniref:Uncharacterized protein n=1 Tax=Ananas comosus var. bracteatus TaxID=296719 RepID=A0A6V7NGB4_ANACO|nr:unnamed protein product [Ananas comosus var. bracteatus]